MTNDNKHPNDSVSDEVSAFGKRVKGAAKDGVGAVTGNESLEREGERENAEGRARQGRNDVFDQSDGPSVADRPTSSNPGSPPNSIREETAAFGERVKGAAKDSTGAVLGDDYWHGETLVREFQASGAEHRASTVSKDGRSVVVNFALPGSDEHVERLVEQRVFEEM